MASGHAYIAARSSGGMLTPEVVNATTRTVRRRLDHRGDAGPRRRAGEEQDEVEVARLGGGSGG
ncbi:MAG: hypothetical protein R3290_02280, partial [Acidimicrobiia bacterium]|nr:hypothetical protein [Acidimicrobiia bacterium]